MMEERMEVLQSDLDALVRVRTRLTRAPDSALSKILAGLLPRLLERMEKNYCLYTTTTAASCSKSDNSSKRIKNEDDGKDNESSILTLVRKDAKHQALVDQTQSELVGLLSHAVERIRIGQHTIPYGTADDADAGSICGGAAPWIDALLPLLQRDWESPVAMTFLLMILQTSLPRYAEKLNITKTNTQNNNEKQRQYDLLVTALLPALTFMVNNAHQKMLLTAASNKQQGDDDEGKSSIPQSLLLTFRSSSWLCLDVLAIHWGLPLSMDTFDEFSWSTPCCSTAKEDLLLDPGSTSSSFGPLPLDTPGSFHLWLDLLLFWPEQDKKNNRRVVRTQAEIMVENSTGMTPEGIERLNHRRKGGQSFWNLRYLRELKLACVHSIVGAPFRTMRANAIQATKLQDNVPLMRHLIICILTASTGSMHGKVALEYINEICLQLSVRNQKGCRGQLASPSDPWVFDGASLVLACCLLVFVLGDEDALTVLSKNATGRKRIDEIIGPYPISFDDEDDAMMDVDDATGNRDGTNLHFERLRRAPVPYAVADHTVGFIMTKLLPSTVDRLAPKTAERANASFGLVAMADTSCLALFVELVEALATAKGTIGAQWAMHCLDSISSQLGANRLIGTDFVQKFGHTCLAVASRVLSQIAEVDAETMVTLGEIQHPAEPHQPVPAGVHGPFRGRRDLNVMLAQHRTSLKKRQLHVDCALKARKQAYRVVTDLATAGIDISHAKFSAGVDGNKTLAPVWDMPIILLKCATGEQDTAMHPYVTDALEAWLEVYKTSLKTAPPEVLKGRVAALLPSLLSAVCCESSVARMAAARWAVLFIKDLDAAVTLHVCTFLSDDVDTMVSSVAKEGLKLLTDCSRVGGTRSACSISFLDRTSEKGAAQLKADLNSRIDHVASSLDVPDSVARELLSSFGFRAKEIIEKCNADRWRILQHCGVSCRCGQVVTMAESTESSVKSEFLCGICYDEVELHELYEMPCAHKFCLACWQSYLSCALQDRPTSATTALVVLCPEQSCNEHVVKEDVEVIEPRLLAQWEDIEVSSFVGSCDDLSSCPGADCKVVAKMEGHRGCYNPAVNCSQCKTTFCFSCGSSPHRPAKCSDYEEWMRIFGSSQFWVKKNAKPCPGCKAPIEKNQGCNHMQCSLCRHDFCWLCLGPLRTHLEPHICNKYEPHTSAEDDEERRALFFTDRFKAHEDAEIFARNEVKSFQEKQDKLSSETLWFASDDDLEHMMTAASTLVQARNFLKNSYVAAWAMRKDLEHRDVFDSHQANLELFTEKLSQLLLTKVHQLYAEQGARAIHMHFRAMVFSTASVDRYMERIITFMESN